MGNTIKIGTVWRNNYQMVQVVKVKNNTVKFDSLEDPTLWSSMDEQTFLRVFTPLNEDNSFGYVNEFSEIEGGHDDLCGGAVAKGIKHDSQKPRMSLLPANTLPQVIDVLEYGAVKYAPDNWQAVPQPRTRYYDAAMRHIQSWWGGEKRDSESGKPHLAHAICCLLFLLWFEKE